MSSNITFAKGNGLSSWSITVPLTITVVVCAARWLKPNKKKNEVVKINLEKYMVLDIELFSPIQREKGAKTKKCI